MSKKHIFLFSFIFLVTNIAFGMNDEEVHQKEKKPLTEKISSTAKKATKGIKAGAKILKNKFSPIKLGFYARLAHHYHPFVIVPQEGKAVLAIENIILFDSGPNFEESYLNSEEKNRLSSALKKVTCIVEDDQKMHVDFAPVDEVYTFVIKRKMAIQEGQRQQSLMELRERLNIDHIKAEAHQQKQYKKRLRSLKDVSFHRRHATKLLCFTALSAVTAGMFLQHKFGVTKYLGFKRK